MAPNHGLQVMRVPSPHDMIQLERQLLVELRHRQLRQQLQIESPQAALYQFL